jgi:hypothetical protein
LSPVDWAFSWGESDAAMISPESALPDSLAQDACSRNAIPTVFSKDLMLPSELCSSHQIPATDGMDRSAAFRPLTSTIVQFVPK